MLRHFILSLICILAFAVCVLAQNISERPLIMVSGQAEINVTPDIAVFTLRVVSLDKDIARAKTINDESVRKTLVLAKTYQIAPEDVQTNYISVDEKYSDYESERKPRVFLGYQVTKKIVLKLRDMKRIEGLLSDVISSGVNRIDDIDFRTTQIRKFKDQARAMAMKAAREKAIALTGEINQTIGKAYSITEEALNNYSAPNYSQNAMSNATRSEAGGGASGDYSDSEGTIAIGQISITARVLVSFELK
jgi:uncharacterized protein YggE